MANKFDLKVDLAIPKNRAGSESIDGIQLGSCLTGHILLTPLEDIGCRGIWLEIGYKEGGNGTPAENRMIQEMIYEGALKSGRAVSHDLNFRVPDECTVSYTGQYVRIEWFVRVRIDIPLWFDNRTEFVFPVIPKLMGVSGLQETEAESPGEDIGESIHVEFPGQEEDVYRVDI